MRHETFMAVAHAVSQESKCVRLQVGSVLVKDGHIISSGYNGTAKGMPNCNEVVGIEIPIEDHHCWSQKHEIHSEMNCLLYCPVSTQGTTIYVTDSPCFNCTKHLIAAGVKEIYFDRMYDRYHRELKDEWQEVLDTCTEAGVKLVQLKGNGYTLLTQKQHYRRQR
tara:strand:+ start:2498 stop:2992 length:495 start_codon:yes stop_codon:yes gene_type:complete